MLTTFQNVRFMTALAVFVFALVVGCGGTTSLPEQSEEALPPSTASPNAGAVTRTCGGPHRGPDCADDEYCDFELDAVCGADERTGVCRPRPHECPAGGSPVCGCNDQTFPSACEAHRFGVAVQGLGACGPPI